MATQERVREFISTLSTLARAEYSSRKKTGKKWRSEERRVGKEC